MVVEEEKRLQSHILPHPADAGQNLREPHDGPANRFAEHYLNLNKPMSDTSTQNHPAVSKIRIEYEDGSHDEMELLDAAQGLYNWVHRSFSIYVHLKSVQPVSSSTISVEDRKENSFRSCLRTSMSRRPLNAIATSISHSENRGSRNILLPIL